jgi:exonuclease SbcC
MITHVEMINWRAYERKEVNLLPGVTFIMGANGAGKTSILEAVAYALTGEPSTVKERGKLLRRPDQSATVRLSFTVEDHPYLIERSQSLKRAEGARLIEVETGAVLASNHSAVTAQVEQLLGVSADFLQRIVYMAEGDVFRFLSQPPGKSLDLQIRYVLGLTQMDEFVHALDLAEKELKRQMKETQEVLTDLTQLQVRRGADLERHVHNMETSREQLLKALRTQQNVITRYQSEHADLMRLAPLLTQAALVLPQETDVILVQTPISALFTQWEQQLTQTQDIVQQCQLAQARSEGEQMAYQRIQDMLHPYAGRTETMPCPVCGKPLTSDERDRIAHDIQNNLQRITDELQQQNARQREAEQAQIRLRERVAGLRELRNALTHIRIQTISAEVTWADLQQTMQQQQTRFQQELAELQRQAETLEQQIAQLERETAEYLAIQRRLLSLGYASPEEASESLVRLETRALSLRAAHQAAQETLATQRNLDLQTIYSQVTRVWEAFIGENQWQMQLDREGMPILENQSGQQFELSQFSGGQKTALLVMLHTIIAHHFSHSDFLMIDEPLEHLDAINRRSLIHFLVSAYRKRIFQQAIIATFEESLIRKYMSDEGVNVVYV